jgi:hypothetical protein
LERGHLARLSEFSSFDADLPARSPAPAKAGKMPALRQRRGFTQLKGRVDKEGLTRIALLFMMCSSER